MIKFKIVLPVVLLAVVNCKAQSDAILNSAHTTDTSAAKFDFPLAAWCQASQQDLVWSSRTHDLALSGMFQNENQPAARRSVARAAIFSAVIPGAGQIYNRSYLKGLLFLGAEVGAWVAYSKYTDQGNKKTDEFEAFADAHWDEQAYWNSVSELANSEGYQVDPGNLARLREYERSRFSHYLPESKNQTYYENIGKYDQFNAGWDDGSGEILRRDSQNRLDYTTMRRLANDQFRYATLSSSLAMVNHLVSMIEAAYSAHKFNQAQTKGTSFGMKLKKHYDELMPVLAVRVDW